ncbi:CRTAC1 family protein [bacterium]|nr:CRTAC1 family protein [bacterium]
MLPVLLIAVLLGGAAPTAPPVASLRFVDVGPGAGLLSTVYCGGPDKDHLLESVGSGGAFLDFDADGHLDIYIVNGWLLSEEPSAIATRGRNTLYRNRGDGTFEDVTEAAGVGDDSWGCGVCVGDADGDGRVDLYVVNFGANRLYRNRGDGTSEDVSAAAGVDDPGWGSCAAFFDADGDGDADLYVSNYVEATEREVLSAGRTNRWRKHAKVMVGPFGMRGGRDRFYRNRGDGTFDAAEDEAGLVDLAEAYGMGVCASDLDDDGDIDLYVANDSNPNYLYENQGDGTFRDVGGWSGAGFSADGAAQAGMGVDCADFDGDGLGDLFVTNFARDTCTLYRNLGGLFFDDVTREHGIRETTYESLSWGCAFLDPDLDGALDVVIVNGHIYPQVDDFEEFRESYRQLPLLLRNRDGRLENASPEAGPAFATPSASRGLAVGDYDGDGDPDLLIVGIDMRPRLLRNDTAAKGHWIKVRLLDAHGAPALNVRARVAAGGRSRVAEARSGSTYQSQSSTDLLFGIGEAARVDTLEVSWPSGARTVETGLPADGLFVVREVR